MNGVVYTIVSRTYYSTQAILLMCMKLTSASVMKSCLPLKTMVWETMVWHFHSHVNGWQWLYMQSFAEQLVEMQYKETK